MSRVVLGIRIRCSTVDTEEALIWGTMYSYGIKLSVSSRKVTLAGTPGCLIRCAWLKYKAPFVQQRTLAYTYIKVRWDSESYSTTSYPAHLYIGEGLKV